MLVFKHKFTTFLFNTNILKKQVLKNKNRHLQIDFFIKQKIEIVNAINPS